MRKSNKTRRTKVNIDIHEFLQKLIIAHAVVVIFLCLLLAIAMRLGGN